MDPCGNPKSGADLFVPVYSLTLSRILRPKRKLLRSFSMFPLMPKFFSLTMSDGRWTESKAFSKSMNKIIQASFCLLTSVKFARSLNKYLVVECPAINPSWSSSRPPILIMNSRILQSKILSSSFPKYDDTESGLNEPALEYVDFPSLRMNDICDSSQIHSPLFRHQLNITLRD